MAIQYTGIPVGNGYAPVHGLYVHLPIDSDFRFQVRVSRRYDDNTLWVQINDTPQIMGGRAIRYGPPISVNTLIQALEQGSVQIDWTSAQDLLRAIQKHAPQFVGTEFLVSKNPPLHYPAYGISTEHLRDGSGGTMKLEFDRPNFWPEWGWEGRDLTDRVVMAINYIMEYGYTQAPPDELLSAPPPVKYGPSTQPLAPRPTRTSKWDTVGFKPGPSYELFGGKLPTSTRRPYREPEVVTTKAPKKKRIRKR